MEALPDLPGGEIGSVAYAVSGDGSVIVGFGSRGSRYQGEEAVRWENGVATGLGTLCGSFFRPRSIAHGVSADGSVVVGQSCGGSGFQAFRWEAGTMVALDPGSPDFAAYGVSADGSVVVGLESIEGCRWKDAVLERLGILPHDAVRFSPAHAASADGSVIAGTSGTFFGYEAFRWTRGTGMVGLGDLPGGELSSLAYAVSADGSVVVGTGTTERGREAFWWDAAHGIRRLAEVLAADHGLDPSGWVLQEARGLTPDAGIIVGWRLGPRGRRPGSPSYRHLSSRWRST